MKVRQRDRVVEVAHRNGQRNQAEAVFHRELRFTIPADEKPTSETTEKQEEWLILVHLAFSHRIPFQEEYTFLVFSA
jgi:hypothetical protein